MTTEAEQPVGHCNEVRLVGRVADTPLAIELPSGDAVVTARVIVERPQSPPGRGPRAIVDTLACAAWTPGLRRTLARWQAGDVVEVSGALRRRFWRVQGVAQSRYEVELRSGRRLARAPSPPA